MTFCRTLETFSTLIYNSNLDEYLMWVDGDRYSFGKGVNLRDYYTGNVVEHDMHYSDSPKEVDYISLRSPHGVLEFSLSQWGFDKPIGLRALDINLPGNESKDFKTIQMLEYVCSYDLRSSNLKLEVESGGGIIISKDDTNRFGILNHLNNAIDSEFLTELMALNYVKNEYPKGARRECIKVSTEAYVEPLDNSENVARLKRAVGYGERYGTCDRLKVGAAIYNQGKLVGMGFNTSIGNSGTCNELGHLMIKGSCKRTIHAEMNAVIDAMYNGVSLKGATLYCSHRPCVDCAKILECAGVKTVFFLHDYLSDYGALNLKIDLIRLDLD